MYLDSKIFLCDENDEGYGFVCSEKDDFVFAHFWAPGDNSSKTQRKTVYHSTEYMYNQAKQLSTSMLANYSPLHTAQNLMFQSYINWYENKHNLPQNSEDISKIVATK